MNIEIINDIFENYLDNNYIKTITLIEEYFKTKYLGIYDKILDIYIDCQIQLGYYTEAKKIFPS